MITKRGILSWGAAILLLLAACKKSKTSEETTNPIPVTPTTPATGTALDLMRDSVYLYAKEDYYWYDALPDYATFAPRSFTGADDLSALKKEVFALSQYKINPATNKAYEYSGSTSEAKYSFIDDGTTSQRLSAVTGDFGFQLNYQSTNDLRVIYVYPGSPADQAGIKRAYQITAINGRTDLAYNSANVNYIVNAYTNSSNITMTLRRPDATTFNVTMNTAVYKVNPVLAYKVLTSGTKKVGYLVFNSFVSKASAQASIDAAFSLFTSQGINELVVDLRYNGGGYVETAEYLCNLIAPTAANGKVMYTTYYNDNLTSGKTTLLKNQWRRDSNGSPYNYSQVNYSVSANTENFSKQGSLNLSRVFFLVTGSTASSSELTINNLRPYMDVQLIGGTTYGKPVGFFDIRINKYYMYIPEFETKNAQAKGGYYTGMVPASTDYPGKLSSDDYTKDFGDPSELMLSQALAYIGNGKYNSQELQIQSAGVSTMSVASQNAFSQQLNAGKFNGMLKESYPLKK